MKSSSSDGGLTPDSFDALLRALGGGDRGNGALVYEQLRRKLIRIFEWHGCTRAEELVDETFDRVARRLADGLQLEDPARYVYGVARLVYKEWARKEASHHQKLDSGEWPPPQADPEESDWRLDALRLCLGKLDEDQQHLVLEYHRGENNIEHRKKLAERLGIPINALRIRVFRLRRKLEECLEKRLAS